MQSLARWLTVAVVATGVIEGSNAQLIANLKNFVSNIPTFTSNNIPSFQVQNG